MSLTQQKVSDYVTSYNLFTKVEAKAVDYLNKAVLTIVGNILANLAFVADACKCKVVNATHFNAVSSILKYANQQQAQNGGAIVLPSEYFGVESGMYFDESVVAPMETNLFSNENLARVEHVLKGGARTSKSLIDQAIVKAAVAKYNSSRQRKLKLSSEAYGILVKAVQANIVHMVEMAASLNTKSKEKKLTVKVLERACKKDTQLMLTLNL